MAQENMNISNANTFMLHTGNVVNCNDLKKKMMQNPVEELTECIGSTVTSWVKNTDQKELWQSTDIVCSNKRLLETLSEEERSEMKVTVKLFLTQKPDKAMVNEAINKALNELGTSYIETVLLSLPSNKQDVTINDIKDTWTALEQCVAEEKVFSLGISDLNKEQLEELYEWAKVKPIAAQVNLDLCCVVPQELQKFTKEKDIQLLTHNDPADILPVQTFHNVLQDSFTRKDIDNLEPMWVARYSVLIKSRGIITTKGYIMKAGRNAAQTVSEC